MKIRRTPTLTLVLLFLTLLPTFCFGQAGPAGLDRMIQQIESHFPYLEGYVVDVQGGQLTLDLKLGQNLKPGDNLMVLRYGEEIIHPVTKKKLGRHETDLGRAEVLQVRKDYSIARMDNPATPVKKGDGVRSYFRKVSVLVAPVLAKKKTRFDAAALGLDIESLLNSHPRFEVPTFDLRVWAAERKVSFKKIPQADDLLHLQKSVDVDYLLLPRLSGLGKQAVLDYRLISAVDGSIVSQSRLMTDASSITASKKRKRPRKGSRNRNEVQRDFTNEDGGLLEFITKQELPFEIIDMDVGDVNGDGKTDYIFITKERVRFYQFKNQTFKQISLYRAPSSGVQFLSVDVADINGNGRDEVFVTSSVGQKLESFVLELKKGRKRMEPIWDDQNMYFRVIKPPGKKPLLITQEPGHDRPFRPTVYEYAWKGDEYEETREIELPHIPGRPVVTIYGLTIDNITPSKALETIFLDSKYHLRVYSGSGRLLIKSDEYYGHDPRVINVAVKDQIPGLHNSDNDVQAVPFRGRVVVSQVGKEKYLIIPKNHRLGGSYVDRLTVVNNSSLVVLKIDREGLHQIHETRKQSGYLATYQVADSPDSSKKLAHSVHVTSEGTLGLGKKTSTIFTYSW